MEPNDIQIPQKTELNAPVHEAIAKVRDYILSTMDSLEDNNYNVSNNNAEHQVGNLHQD